MKRETNAWLFNIESSNWEACVNGPFNDSLHPNEYLGQPCHGIRSQSATNISDLETDDLIFARKSEGNNIGIKGIWRYQGRHQLPEEKELWEDDDYRWILYCEPIERELNSIIPEDWNSFANLIDGDIQSATKRIEGEISNLSRGYKREYISQILNSGSVSRSTRMALKNESESVLDASEKDQVHPKRWEEPQNPLINTQSIAEFDHLHFPDRIAGPQPIVKQIDTALRTGKHVILTGPPGSGKTELAKAVAKHYVDEECTVATATEDWSTFDTIGGYQPTRDADNSLTFRPGLFLSRVLDPSIPEAKNEWLVIDELNRADIDKAFGSLFSALTGNTVTLPFETKNGQVVLHGDPSNPELEDNSVDDLPLTDHNYYIPESWRLIATMNTADKNSLYKLSYAFMRRFAFISVPVPDREMISPELIKAYAEKWGMSPEENICEDIQHLWSSVQRHTEVGPAIIRDILLQLEAQSSSIFPEFTYPFRMYVVPQLDDVSTNKIQRILKEVSARIDRFDYDLAEEYVEDYLGRSFNNE